MALHIFFILLRLPNNAFKNSLFFVVKEQNSIFAYKSTLIIIVFQTLLSFFFLFDCQSLELTSPNDNYLSVDFSFCQICFLYLMLCFHHCNIFIMHCTFYQHKMPKQILYPKDCFTMNSPLPNCYCHSSFLFICIFLAILLFF